MEFAVPLYPEDLEVEQTGNKFCVKHVEDLESPDVDSGALLDGESSRCCLIAAPTGNILTLTACINSSCESVCSCIAAAVGDTLAQTDIVCAAVLDNRVFDRLYSLIK